MSPRARASRAAARPAPSSEELASFFQGLADPIRVEILEFLLDRPKTTGEIVRHIGRPQPTVSSHLTCLRFCGYVEARRAGRNVWYEIIDSRVRTLLRIGEHYLHENAERITACRVTARER
ncbi:MAG: ArsR/SmtB family transcription factor [Candidatus Limnocylindria bacterium]